MKDRERHREKHAGPRYGKLQKRQEKSNRRGLQLLQNLLSRG